MSDFVTELRREVVTAHAQHRTSALRTRRRRRRPVLAGAVALAALLLAVVWIARSIPPPERSAEPRVVKVVQIGGDPGDGVLAAGSLWVTDFRGKQVVRIDPARRKVIARVPLDETPEDITAGEGSVWARGVTADGGSRIWRIDPATNRVTDQFDADYSPGIVVAAGAIWAASWDSSDHLIDRLSLTGHRLGELPLPGGMTLAAGGRWIWNVSPDGTVARIDARDGRIAHRWVVLAPNQSASGDPTGAMVADRTGAWLADAYGRRIMRLEGDRVTRSLRTGDIKPILARATDGLWVVASNDPGGAHIMRIDPRTGNVTATVNLGTHYPRTLVPSRAGLWVVAGDGTVVLVAG